MANKFRGFLNWPRGHLSNASGTTLRTQYLSAVDVVAGKRSEKINWWNGVETIVLNGMNQINIKENGLLWEETEYSETFGGTPRDEKWFTESWESFTN